MDERLRRATRTAGLFALTAAFCALAPPRSAQAAEEVLPKHITPDTLKAVRAGLDYLARSQGSDGAWGGDQGGRAYPVAITSLAGMAFLAHGNTPTRGKYAPQIKAAVDY